MPEGLWKTVPARAAEERLGRGVWPQPGTGLADPAADARFARIQEVIVAIRNIRAEYRIAPKARIAATITTGDVGLKRAIAGERETILRLAQLAELALDGKAAARPGGPALLGDGRAAFRPPPGAIDVQQEGRRLP